MNVSQKNLPKSEVELTIELSVEEFKPYVEQATIKLAKEVKVPGFRPGKAPFDVLKKQVGEMHIYQEAAEQAIAKTFPEAVLQQNLTTIGRPRVDVAKLAPGNPLVFKAVVALLPQVKLGDYKKVTAEKKEITVGEKDVEGTIQNLRKMFGKEKTVNRTVQENDKVEIDMETFVDNVPIDGGKSAKQPVTIGEKHFIPGFEEALIGMAAGEKKEFDLAFPKEYHRKDLAGKPVSFKVQVNTVSEVEMPELDDNFAKMVGQFEKLADLQKQIEQNIKQEKTAKERQRWELAIIDSLISQTTFDEIPDTLIEAEVHKMLHELEQDVSQQGMKFDDYLASIKKTKDELSKELQPKGVKRVQTALVLRAIADAENISVEESEVTAEIEKEQQQYQGREDILKQLQSDEYRDYLSNIMRSRKVFALFDPKMDT